MPPIVRHTFVELVVAFPDASVQLAPAPRFAAALAQDFLEVYAATNNKFSTLAAKKSAFKHHLLHAAARASWDQPAPAGSCDASQGKFPTASKDRHVSLPPDVRGRVCRNR